MRAWRRASRHRDANRISLLIPKPGEVEHWGISDPRNLARRRSQAPQYDEQDVIGLRQSTRLGEG
jgi:hypothetical protein